jgi:dienelactone hydrolase
MRCSRCHLENPDSLRFCGNCAAPLPGVDLPQSAPDEETLAPTLQPASPPPLAGKYEIAGEIGRGGMGVVVKARDVRLNRWVALKFLPGALTVDHEVKERFLVEAQAAARLSHPNICVVHEVGEDDGRPFIAMEYVAGETVRRRIARAPLDLGEVTALFVQVVAGLEEAHRRGIVHRDIKSANIMVTEAGHVKIMDFGLAKLQGGPSLTKTGTTLGTVSYMSPEQAAGGEVDHRTDLWSAGVVLYEMLTGELPFHGHGEVAVIHAILHEDPRPLTGHTPPVPPPLQRVVARALERSLEARYASASEMLADLRAYQEARRGGPGKELTFRALARLLLRPRVAVPAAVAVLVLALLGVRLEKQRARVRWAREVALPEIARQITENDTWRNLIPTYRLAEEAEVVLGDDPELAALLSRCSLRIDVRTEPPGARVLMKEYAQPEAEWSLLGVTPLEKVRVPIGVFRWKVEKDGYETVLAAASTWDIGGEDIIAPCNLTRKLDAAGSVPAGMVRVAATTARIGTLDDFLIGRHEVTNLEYKAFVDAGGYRERRYWKHPFVKDGRELSWEQAMKELVDASGRPGPATWLGGDFPPGHADYPVSGVSWYEAAAYAEHAGMSLPTADHWDVARGGLTPMIRWPQLGGFALLAPFCNFSGLGPVPVESLPGITAYGAFDMAGNVREWCWNETPQGRAIRGGAWEDNTYEFGNLRQAPAIDRSARNGFRLASYPDREAIPATAFAPRLLAAEAEPTTRAPVSEEVFQVYREQYAYDPSPLHASLDSRLESPDGWVWERVSYDAAYGGERIPAHLFLPARGTPPFQTVVYFPGSASAWMSSSQDLDHYYEFTMFVSFLVRAGRAVVYPVYKGTFERGTPELAALNDGAPTRAYTEYVIQLIKDFRRTVDYLESRADIDRARIAFYGMSWGGALGAIIPAVEERLAASVLVAGGFYLGELVRPEVAPLNYVTRVRTPTLLLNGRYDAWTRPQPMLELLGTPAADKRLVLYDTDHIPPRAEYVRETLAWLDRYLGPVR